MQTFRSLLTSAAELTALLGTPSELSVKKQRSQLDQHMMAFIGESPMVLLGTVGRDGRCDVSPRGDEPGVAKVLGPQTLLIADWSGNRRFDSLRNIIETGRVGLLFLIPGLGETLRVNGQACVTLDNDALKLLARQGKPPRLAIGVEVEECFLQCAKALIRSKLWEGIRGGRRSSLPCFAEMLLDQTKIEGQTVQALDQAIAESYKNRLY